MTDGYDTVILELRNAFGEESIMGQPAGDGIPTLWTPADKVLSVLSYLKAEIPKPFPMLYDLTAIDERTRAHRQDRLHSDFTAVYHLLSFDRNSDIRIKVALDGEYPSLPSITGLWPSANWYEREVWDMFGITFSGHPNLRRILMPSTWKGHPLRKEHPARGTELGRYVLTEEKDKAEERALKFRPDDWGMKKSKGDTDFMFLNLGPHHTATHGVLRIILELDGEEIVDAIVDIGYHHRGAEKMGERQSWHTFIPYTDRIDYMSGVSNNLPYVLAVEKLAGIEVPERVKVIRVMMTELFRIASHLVWYGTFAQDLGQMSAVFYTFNDREYIFRVVEAVCGGRMHPSWFRIGGVAQDLPEGWLEPVRFFLEYLPKRLEDYEKIIMKNRIVKGRTQGVGSITLKEAIEWGITGPNLRACGLEWDLRKKRPYSAYDQFEFDVPTAGGGDCYSRAAVRVEEMRQSLRIIEQCLSNMPSGPYKSAHHLAVPPVKDHTMQDIETLIAHFLGVSWGPVIPPGEAFFCTEAPKGSTGYYLVSDGNTESYRTRIRTPSFPLMQTIPLMCRGLEIADLIAILGSIDFIMGDVDR